MDATVDKNFFTPLYAEAEERLRKPMGLQETARRLQTPTYRGYCVNRTNDNLPSGFTSGVIGQDCDVSLSPPCSTQQPDSTAMPQYSADCYGLHGRYVGGTLSLTGDLTVWAHTSEHAFAPPKMLSEMFLA
eukprot:109469-Prymnesium_polylepis.2